MSFTMTTAKPKVEITSQFFYMRFRYGAENRAAKKHKEESFMKIKLSNIPPGSILKIFSVISAEKWKHPHPNSLDGPDCQAGVYFPKAFTTYMNQEISIPWLQINRTKKDDMDKMLESRSEFLPEEFAGGCHEMRECVQNGKKICSNSVCLCVNVSGTLNGMPYSVYDLSKEIMNEEVGTGLTIHQLSLCSALVHGNVTNFILTSEDSPSIKPGMVDVQMEEVDHTGKVVWTSEIFTAGREDIMYKKVILYPVPAYINQLVTEPVKVMLVLRCRRTQEEARVEFMYQPMPDSVYRKRKCVSLIEKYPHFDDSPKKIQKTAPAAVDTIMHLRNTLGQRNSTSVNPGMPTYTTITPASQHGMSSQMHGVRANPIVQTSQAIPGPSSSDIDMVLDDRVSFHGSVPVPITTEVQLPHQSDLLAMAVENCGVKGTDVVYNTNQDDGMTTTNPELTSCLVRIALKKDDASGSRCFAVMPKSIQGHSSSRENYNDIESRLPNSVQGQSSSRENYNDIESWLPNSVQGQSSSREGNNDIESRLPKPVLDSQQFVTEESSNVSLGFNTAAGGGRGTDKLRMMARQRAAQEKTDVFEGFCGETDSISDSDLLDISHSNGQDHVVPEPVVTEQPSSLYGATQSAPDTAFKDNLGYQQSMSVPQIDLSLISSEAGAIARGQAPSDTNRPRPEHSLVMPEGNELTSPDGTPSPGYSICSLPSDAVNAFIDMDPATLENFILNSSFTDTKE